MHTHSVERWRHDHIFLGTAHARNERRTRIVVALTAAMMVAEIAAGWLFGSMALLADGWHMSTHAGALGIAALAYGYARRHAGDPRYSFGTGKFGDLAGFTSAIVLALIALLMGYESVLRLFEPVVIAFDEAIAVAVLGLLVNLLSAWLLHDGAGGHAGHHHGHGPAHRHGHDHGDVHAHDRNHPHGRHDHRHGATAHHHRTDHNLRSAYVHVLADALTSVLAILALLCGRMFGWGWMDPLMGVVGGVVIARWSWSLIRDTGRVLLDVQPDPGLAAEIRCVIEADADNRIADLHLWRVGPGHVAAIVSLVTDRPRPPDHYKALLAGRPEIAHLTVEVQPCTGGAQRSAA